ncbi:hypothetical protein L6Q21_10105 [Sandaracinobacter sp. RS1-74]|uniref:hypothetical protein n=1 Tax=Sandaracinobacteroides sayramensis TaxID=2913411 RepID=UPI001EDC4341|nr:hypothetical protein [Sandaracinobacteroides sayramensis]MCG2841333.1 hypothetical protein [Sandaracinobacteroides sayramensis]
MTLFAVPGEAQILHPGAEIGWTDYADLALASPVVLVGAVDRVDRLSKKDAPDVPPGQVRALVQAKLQTALKAPSLLPEGAAWLWQGAAGAKGRPPFAREDRLLVFARPMAGGARPEVQALQLVSNAGQQPWTVEAEAQVRAILKEAQQPGALGLMVTGVADGFHTQGDVPGTSESQFFLRTEGGRPLTLVVRRSPGREPEVRASAGDLVERAVPIQPRTLLWRALACGLPAELPPALAGQEGLAGDYRLAREAIGACGRTLPPPA